MKDIGGRSNTNSSPWITLELIRKLLHSSYLKEASFLSIVKNTIIYVFLPITFPIILFRYIKKLREKFGLKKRPLEGKVVLITGATSGIGEALAKSLYLKGCKLIIASRRIEELDRVKQNLVRDETYGTVYIPATLQIDLEDLQSLEEKSKAAIAVYGRIDILVNNAGISFRGNILDTGIEIHQKIMSVNYFGPIQFTKAIGKSMALNNSGRIVFVSSVQGKISIPHRSAYAASKHAVQAFADCLRAELSSKGVGVTVISPSYVQTNLSVNALTSSGNEHGKIDATTASGYSPTFVAEKTIQALLNDENEVTIANFLPKIVILLRTLCPSLFFRLMSNRAQP